MSDYTTFTLPENGLQSAYGGVLPDAVQRFVACALSMVNYDEKVSFDDLPSDYQTLVVGDEEPYISDPNNPEYKDICCADLVTVAYTYALSQQPAADWAGCDPGGPFVTHNCANFYHPCNANASHLQAITGTIPALSANEDWQPGDLIVYGYYGSNPIAQHVIAYVGPVNWVSNGQIMPQGPCIVNASINTDEQGDFVRGSNGIYLFRLDVALSAYQYSGYSWAQHVRITDLWPQPLPCWAVDKPS